MDLHPTIKAALMCHIGLAALVFLFFHFPRSLVIKILEYYYPSVTFRVTVKPRRNPYPRTKIAGSSKIVALSIDDTPTITGKTNPPTLNTRYLIDIMNKYDVTATWFIIGNHVRLNDPDHSLLKELVKNGHELGNHGMYDRMSLRLPSQVLKREIGIVDKIINDVMGPDRNPKHFRPEYRLFNQRMLTDVESLDYKIRLGNNYTFDTYIKDPTFCANRILDSLQPGDIIILHDQPETIAILTIILPEMKRRGYQVTTISKLLSYK